MKRYAIKGFSDWKINEGIIDTIKSGIGKAIDFAKKFPGIRWLRNLLWDGAEFEGPGSGFLNLFVPGIASTLPKGIKALASNLDQKVLANVGISVVEKPYFHEKDSEFSRKTTGVSEAVIPTASQDPTVPNVSYSQYKDAVLDHIRSMKRGVLLKKPIFCWGAPGLGKTAIIYEIAKENNMRVLYANLQNLLPEDVFMPDPKNPRKNIPKDWLPVYDTSAPTSKEDNDAINGENGGILFFDELPRSMRQVQDSFLKFIDEREVNEWRLGSKWVMVAAGNRAEDDPDSYYLSIAGARRFDHINLDPNPAEWIQWAKSQKNPSFPDLDYILPEILSFLTFKKEYFHYNDPEKGKLYPNPASWENATTKIYAAREKAKEDGRTLTYAEVKNIIARSVGAHIVDELDAFFELSKYIDLDTLSLVFTNPDKAPTPKDVEKNIQKLNKDGEGPKRERLRPDVTFAFFANIAWQKAKDEMTKENFDNLSRYILRLKDPAWIQTLITSLGLVSKSFADKIINDDPDTEDFALFMADNFPKIYLEDFSPSNIEK